MTSVNGDTVITMTMKQLLGTVAGGALLFGGALWVVMTFTLGTLQKDVSDIREAVTEAQNRNADTHQTATSADGELRTELAGLTAELKITNAGLSALSQSVAGLDESIKTVDARLAASVLRQEQFESWVVTRLGTDPTKPAALPIEWQKQQRDIITKIRSGDDPLANWFQAVETPPKK